MTEVKILNETHVKPKTLVSKPECLLVKFGLPFLSFQYNQTLIIYKNEGLDFKAIVGKLKGGLEVVLKDFYQLAGKLGKDGEGTFRVQYDGSDKGAGVRVVEAAAEEVTVAMLIKEEDVDRLKKLVPYNGVLNSEGRSHPLLAIQLTELKDGLVMGCAFNHAILDGNATWHFMSSWAEICRGETISNPPSLDGTKARNTRKKPNLPEKAENYGTTPPLREKIFKFSKSSIDQIKSKVNANLLEGAEPFSTFQSLSTHIWLAVTRARQLKPEDITVFTIFADLRKKVDPPVSEFYFGNLIQALFTGTAAGLLAAHPPEFGAGLIQKAINEHDSRAIDARIAEWGSNPKIYQFKDAGANCVVVGSSPWFKVYEVDFGFGKPESVRSGPNNRFDGMVYLYQGKSGDGGIDVEISLDPNAMENLEKDKEFLMEA